MSHPEQDSHSQGRNLGEAASVYEADSLLCNQWVTGQDASTTAGRSPEDEEDPQRCDTQRETCLRSLSDVIAKSLGRPQRLSRPLL